MDADACLRSWNWPVTMTAGELMTLVGVIVAPLAALAGVWLEKRLSSHERALRQEDFDRRASANAVGPMLSVLVDADCDLVTNSRLYEYATAKEAIRGLYVRWAKAREPLLILHVSHRSAEVRELAMSLQVEVEILLRAISTAVYDKAPEVQLPSPTDFTKLPSPRDAAYAWHSVAMSTATELVSSLQPRSGDVPARTGRLRSKEPE